MDRGYFFLRILTILAVVNISSGKLFGPSEPFDQAIDPSIKDVELEANSVQKVVSGSNDDGESWSSWGTWSPCSRTCGGGVAVQMRTCLSAGKDNRIRSGRRRRRLLSGNEVLLPAQQKTKIDAAQPALRPSSGSSHGKRCNGMDKRYHECHTQACPGNPVDFRREQCQAFNKRPYKGVFYDWKPYIDNDNPCLLNCRPGNIAFYATLGTAIDGTTCDKPGYRAVCVQGQCKAVGLNGVISQYGGPAPGQMTCGPRLVSGIFQRPQLTLGYTTMATIPIGACRINVSQMHHSDNNLALKTTNGTFIINGKFAIGRSGVYEAAGTSFLYRRQTGSFVETISAPGPLTQSVDIMILYQRPNPGIKYEYTIQIPENEENEQTPPQPRPSPHEVPSPRHHIASSNHHSRAVHPEAPPPENLPSKSSVFEVDGNSIEPRRVDKTDSDRFPYGSGVLATESEKPTQSTQRHRRRKFSWKVFKYTACSKACAGFQMPVMSCVRDYNQSPAADRRCGPQPTSAHVARPCGGPCPAKWVPQAWGACSATCDYALQTRQVHCRQDVAHHSLNVRVPDAMCTDSPPPTSQKCQLPDCTKSNEDNRDEVQLKSNDLGSPSTGYARINPDLRTGLRSRGFKDREETDRFSDAANPVIIARYPNDTQARRPAPTNDRGTDELSNEISSPDGGRNAGSSSRTNGHWKSKNAWIYSEWTQECSEECGKGLQTRSVRCADSSGCDEQQRLPDSRACSSDRKCSTQSSKWFTGPWSQCSNPCAINGRMTREVVCMSYNRGQHKVSMGGCSQQPKPEADVPCPPSMLRGDCEPEWFLSEWSQCLGSCGNTYQTRWVTCQSSSGGPEVSCKLPRPSDRRECVPSHCHLGGFTPRPDTKNDKDDENSIDDPAITGDCSDKIASCHLAVQARLCQYKYYANSCCASCKRAPALS